MNPTFDIIATITVPATYSWDDGIPVKEYSNLNENTSSIKQITLSGEQFVGYAPYFTVLLSSTPDFVQSIPTSNVLPYKAIITREVNFGDYYNSATNYYKQNSTNLTTNSQFFISHTYVMPGTYSITYTQTIYYILTSYDANFVYKQQTGYNTKPIPFAQQWYNFQSNSHNSSTNTVVPWISAEFQQPNQLIWNETRGECAEVNYINSNIVWQWDNLVQYPATAYVELCGAPLTWDDLSCYSPKGATWNFTKQFFRGDVYNISLSSTSQTLQRKFIIKVLETPPEAYLTVGLPTERGNSLTPISNFSSPITVQLSPRYIKCGSFPVEKIVWDLGDGSPLLVQRRWAPTIEDPFYFSGAIENDQDDPRNYDVIHTYTKTPNSSFCFYPSITAYASSTGASDTASVTVGPLQADQFEPATFKMLQTELTDNGRVLLGLIDSDVTLWKTENT